MRITITEAEKAEIEAALEAKGTHAVRDLARRLFPDLHGYTPPAEADDVLQYLLAHAEVEPEPFKLPEQAGVLEIRKGDGTLLASKPLFVGEPLLPPKRGLGDFLPPPGMTAE